MSLIRNKCIYGRKKYTEGMCNFCNMWRDCKIREIDYKPPVEPTLVPSPITLIKNTEWEKFGDKNDNSKV